MHELLDTLNQIQGQELQNLIVLLKNIGRITAAGMFLMATAHLFVLYARAGRKTQPANRIGMVFLMFAVLVWLGMASSKFLFDVNPGDLSLFMFFSTFNNGFLIASLPFIGKGFAWIRKIKLFRNRLVWVISALILCMAFSLLLLLTSKVAPTVSQNAEIAFSMLSMSLLGYAAFSSFRAYGAKPGTLIIVAIAPLVYALLQLILNHVPADHVAQFWILRTVALVIANSTIIGLFLLVSANLLLGNLEQSLASAQALQKKQAEQQLHWTSQTEALLTETQTLRALLLEKEDALRALQAEAAPKPATMSLQRIRIGFEGHSIDKYLLDLHFVLGDENIHVRCANSKLTVPHAHWIIFALARKKGITLRHLDIAQNKFQMIKYLNTFTGNHKIAQEHVFRNNGGEFDLSIDQDGILLEDTEHYAQHFHLLETFKKYWQSFGITGGSKNANEVFQDALTQLLQSA